MIEQFCFGRELPDNVSANLINIYKKWRDADIIAELDKNRSDLIMVYQNITHDFNKASAIRSGNAFNIKESYIVGARKMDKRGCVGSHRYVRTFHADTFDEVFQALKANGYTIYAVDNISSYSPQNIFDCNFPRKSAFVMGEEQKGLDDETIRKCDGMVFIEQFGSVRSLNVACAASCIMMEYSRRYRK